MHYSQKEAEQLILEEYGDEDPVEEAPLVRSGYGSAHAETPIHGESWCEKCGWVERGSADPRFHPEVYL